MEIIEESKDKKVFKEDNIFYTMIDMGEYIGYRSRQWYEKAKEKWYLMYMDDNNSFTHVSALVDDLGNYIRFLIDKGNVRRGILLSGGRVYSDFVSDKSGEDMFNPLFYSLDGDPYSQEKYLLKDYIENPKEFNLEGSTIKGEIPSLDILVKFLAHNKELSDEIINGSGIRL